MTLKHWWTQIPAADDAKALKGADRGILHGEGFGLIDLFADEGVSGGTRDRLQLLRPRVPRIIIVS